MDDGSGRVFDYCLYHVPGVQERTGMTHLTFLNGLVLGVAIGIVLIILLTKAHGLDLIVCRPSPGDTNGQHWSWYIVDGKKCWFEGRPKSKPRDSLYWPGEVIPIVAPVFAEPPELKPVAPEWEVEYRWPQGVR